MGIPHGYGFAGGYPPHKLGRLVQQRQRPHAPVKVLRGRHQNSGLRQDGPNRINGRLKRPPESRQRSLSRIQVVRAEVYHHQVWSQQTQAFLEEGELGPV